MERKRNECHIQVGRDMEKNSNYKILPGAMASYKGMLYMIDLYSNALFSMKYEDEYARCIAQFENENSIQMNLYTDIIEGEDKLFCIPHGAMSLGIYDLNEKTIYTRPLPMEIREKYSKFKTAVYDKGELYLLGYGIQNIWCYSVERDEFSEITVPESTGLFMAGAIVENTLYFVSKASSVIWKMDCTSKKIQMYKTSVQENGYADIRAIGDKVFAVGFASRRLYRMVEEDLCGCGLEIAGDVRIWPHERGLAMGKDELAVFSSPEGSILIYHIAEGNKESFPLSKGKSEEAVGNLLLYGDKIIVWFFESQLLYRYDVCKQTEECRKLYAETAPRRRFERNRAANIFPEKQVWGLKEYIDALNGEER